MAKGPSQRTADDKGQQLQKPCARSWVPKSILRHLGGLTFPGPTAPIDSNPSSKSPQYFCGLSHTNPIKIYKSVRAKAAKLSKYLRLLPYLHTAAVAAQSIISSRVLQVHVETFLLANLKPKGSRKLRQSHVQPRAATY